VRALSGGLDEGAELLAHIRVDPLLVAGVGGAAFEQGLADFPVDPAARQHRAQHLRLIA
jgi:hypothetical protein